MGGFGNQWDEINFCDQVVQLLTVLVSSLAYIWVSNNRDSRAIVQMVCVGQPGNLPCYLFSHPAFPLIPSVLVNIQNWLAKKKKKLKNKK